MTHTPALSRPATAFGWQRLPAADLPFCWAWEHPDGAVLIYTPAGTVPMLRRAAPPDATAPTPGVPA